MRKLVALVAVAALVAFAAPAFAANPFMDVPMNHWAYDAVSQLAARGIVTGYPDGAFKGQWKATRYEMASVVARALAYVDMNKASKEDLELLKKLVVEFKDELDALGVKVEDLDKRVGVLEDNLGGWKINGEFELRYRNFDNDADENDLYFDDARLTLQKKIDDKVTWVGRFENQGSDMNGGFRWEKFYLDVALPWDMTMRVGRQVLFPMEFYLDNDTIFFDSYSDGFKFVKPFSMGEFEAYVGHEESGDAMPSIDTSAGDYFEYYAKLKVNFNEQFGMYGMGYWVDYEDATDVDFESYWVAAWVNFTPGVKLVGEYFWEEVEANTAPYDEPNAWHAVLTVDQDVLGFTSIGVEYWDMDQGFAFVNDPFANYAFSIVGSYASPVSGVGMSAVDADTTAWGVFLNQKWNDTWKTFQRYVDVDFDGTGDLDVTNWSFGVGYNYTSNLYFELVYDDVDYGDDIGETDDSMIQFKTYVYF